MERSFKVNSGPVVFENYESESLAINLDTGTYYSLTGPASRLWTMLSRGTPSARIAEYFAAAHEGDPAQIADSVRRFLERLESEQLIVEDTGAAAMDGAGQQAPPEQRTPFEDFDMRVFTDMQDLLMLDPIHDADEAGWPSARG
jgi:hypothetical protein